MPPALLVSLGSSYGVVPEAYLMGNGPEGYRSVTVLTTSGTAAAVGKCRDWFARHAPETPLDIRIIDDLPDIRHADDHARFEEALLRVHFHCLHQLGGDPQALHVCLSGGFKTISSAVHQVADLLGCGRLFHLTTPSSTAEHPGPKEVFAAIDAELEARRLHPCLTRVDLGPRAGWPTIQALAAEARALPATGPELPVADTRLREKVLARVTAANRLAASEPELATLPFPQLARWAPGDRAWLESPLDPATDRAWLLALPKVELHCHLGGFATHGPELDAVRAAAADPAALPPLHPHCAPPAGWPLPPDPIGLEPYRQLGDNNGSALLRDPGCLEKHIELLCDHLRAQNIRHAEIRCSPANYASPGRSPWTVLGEIIAHFNRFTRPDPQTPPLDIQLILIATRRSEGDYRTAITRHLTLAVTAAEEWTTGCRVVGVDLAGFEDPSTRAHCFRDDFRLAHRAGLSLTVHAGENDEAEAIWSAVFDLSAMRLGHALSLRQSPDLMRSIAARRIAVEMCPYANLQIKGFPLDDHAATAPPASRYPLRDYLRAHIPVTVNTDNISISAASLTDNFLLLPRLCPGITRLEILQLLRHAIDHAFLPPDPRLSLLALPIAPPHRPRLPALTPETDMSFPAG